MKALHIQTLLSHSTYLKNKYNKDVYFKLEALQPTGSFKLRGIGRLCSYQHKRGAKGFAAFSAGNAGVTVAYCGMKLGVPTTVFIPSTSNPIYLERIKSYGADVVVGGTTVADAFIAAKEYAAKHQSVVIHPFDHPQIWHGHSTLMTEVVNQIPKKPDAVIVAVGGGGLACGILEGMHRYGWDEVPLIAVETKGADVFYQSVVAGHPVTLTAITSKATSLGATYVAPKLWDWTKHHLIKNVQVTDEEATNGSISFAKDQRILVELASGAALNLVYENHAFIKSYKTILVIVCGGLNITHIPLNNI